MKNIKVDSLQELKDRIGNKVALLGEVFAFSTGEIIIKLVFANTMVTCKYDVLSSLSFPDDRDEIMKNIKQIPDKIEIREDFNKISLYEQMEAFGKLQDDLGRRLSYKTCATYCEKVCELLDNNVELWMGYDAGEEINRFDF